MLLITRWLPPTRHLSPSQAYSHFLCLTSTLCRAPHHRTCHFNLATACQWHPGSVSATVPPFSLRLMGSVNLRKAAWKMKRKAIKPKTTRQASKQRHEEKKQWRWAGNGKQKIFKKKILCNDYWIIFQIFYIICSGTKFLFLVLNLSKRTE